MSNKTKMSLTILSVTATFLATGLTACGNSKWHEVARQTGDPVAEAQTTPTRARDLRPGQLVTTAPERVIIKSRPDEDTEEDRVLDRGTPVTVVDATPRGADGLIKVVTIDGEEGLVAPNRLETKPVVELKPEDKYFMIQNIATEKVRVYRNCADKDADGTCHHKLVLETDMTAGEDTPDKSRRSILGSYVITKWTKFYEDNAGLFPSFYDSKYPKLPEPGASIQTWMSKDLLPDGKGSMRGSFGWYTAHIGPEASEQWTHGTFGWGADGGKFIDASKDVKMDIRSRGCTRVENRAIAFMREFMVTRSKVFKVYAKETLKDESLARYQGKSQKWSWTLTKDGVRSNTATSGVKANEGKEALEMGEFSLDQKPTVAAGNLYKIKADSFKGVFNIDEGRLAGYSHPKEIRVGGYESKNKQTALSSLVIESK